MIHQVVNCYAVSTASAGMFVGSKTFTHISTSAQSCSLTDLKDTAGSNATLLQNDLIVIALQYSNSANIAQAALLCADPAAAAYTPAHGDLFVDDCNFQTQYKFMGATPDASVSVPPVSASSRAISCTIFAFRGVNTTTPMDTTPTTNSGSGTGHANAPSILPVTPGAWIVVCCGAEVTTSTNLFVNPGDLSSVTNHFRTAVRDTTTFDAVSGIGLKTDWTSGAFDPAVWTLANADTAAYSWAACTLALRPA
jgi:hypothetical protein